MVKYYIKIFFLFKKKKKKNGFSKNQKIGYSLFELFSGYFFYSITQNFIIGGFQERIITSTFLVLHCCGNSYF